MLKFNPESGPEFQSGEIRVGFSHGGPDDFQSWAVSAGYWPTVRRKNGAVHLKFLDEMSAQERGLYADSRLYYLGHRLRTVLGVFKDDDNMLTIDDLDTPDKRAGFIQALIDGVDEFGEWALAFCDGVKKKSGADDAGPGDGLDGDPLPELSDGRKERVDSGEAAMPDGGEDLPGVPDGKKKSRSPRTTRKPK